MANATHTCTAVGVETITSTAQVSGTYVYSYTESDLAGNVSVASGDLTITIDATADAAPGTPDMNTSSDTGSSSTDNITSNTTPDFTMSCVTGSTVTLYDGATSLTSAICAAGTVTLTASTLSEGVHATINAKQTDESGNISVASGNLSVTIDTTAYGTPTAPDLQAGSDLGASPTDNITSGTTPMIDIDCPAIGAVMNVYSDNPASNTLIATHTCLAAGIESVTTSVL